MRENTKLHQKNAIETAKADELQRLRDKNRELHRRCQAAESAMQITVDDCKRQGVSMARSLVNAAYIKLQAENEQLKEELEDYHNAEKFVADPPHDQVCCGCVPILRVQNKRLEELLLEAYGMLEHIGCPNSEEMHANEQCQWCESLDRFEQALRKENEK